MWLPRPLRRMILRRLLPPRDVLTDPFLARAFASGHLSRQGVLPPKENWRGTIGGVRSVYDAIRDGEYP